MSLTSKMQCCNSDGFDTTSNFIFDTTVMFQIKNSYTIGNISRYYKCGDQQSISMCWKITVNALKPKCGKIHITITLDDSST